MSNKDVRIASLDRLSEDPLINDAGSFENTDEGITFVKNSSSQYDVKFVKAYGNGSGQTVPNSTVFDNDTGTIRQTITINRKDGQSVEQSFVDELESRNYDYFFSNLRSNVTFEESLSIGLDPLVDLLGVDFEYNFRDDEYEKELLSVNNHNIIPSMYGLLQQEYLQGQDPNGNAFEENSLRGATSDRLKSNKSLASAGLVSFSEFTNQFFTHENASFLRRNEGVENLFPMYCRINMPYQTNTNLVRSVNRSGLGACIARDFYEGFVQSTATQPSSVSVAGYDYSYAYYDVDGVKIVDNARVTSTTLEIDNWIDIDSGGWYNGIPLDTDSSFIGNETTDSDISTSGPSWAIINGITILRNDLETQIRTSKSLATQAEEMLRGGFCHSEIMFYKVEKYLGEGVDNKVQTFIVSNAEDLIEELTGGSDEKRVSLIDTQVKYGQTYTYSVSAAVAVVGNRYTYENSNRINIGSPSGPVSSGFQIDLKIEPYVRIVEMPYFQVSGKILSDPPLSPELSFVPFKGQTNLIMFHMNTNLGTQDQAPITFTTQEREDMDQLLVNQRRVDGLVKFETDDYNRAYYVYRLASKPNSYQDFADNLLTIASTIGDGTTSSKEAGSANIVIKQTPNKKYYYTFRSADVHGLLSNPSEIYEIELYDDGGIGYPIIRRYEIGEEDSKTSSKSARKLIQIIPRITQAFLNEQASNILNEDGTSTVRGKTNISLGTEDESLFAATSGYGIKTGKRFKIRLTSKSTGKKVDINIDFNTNRVRSEIE